jgi:hypothetical protein
LPEGATMMNKPRLDRVTSATLLTAAVYSIALVVAGFVAPVYRSETGSSSGEVTQGTDTLVGVNGRGAAFVLGVPLLATLVVACALWLGSRRGAVPLAWTLTGVLAAFNLLAMASIGIFVLPVTAALILACTRSRPRPGRPAAAASSAAAG